MPRRISTRALVESAFLVAISTVLCVLDAYVPFLALVYPLPIVVLVVRWGVRSGIWATLVTVAITTMMVGPFQGVTVLTLVGIVGITMAWCIRSRLAPLHTLLFTSLATAVSLGLTVGLGALLGGFSPEELWTSVQESMGAAISFYRSLGVAESELERAQTFLTQLVETARLTLPALLLLTVVGNAGLNYLAARLVLGKLGYKLREIPPFSRWRLTWPFGWGYIAGLVLNTVGQMRSMPLVSRAGLNLLVVFDMLFLMQGLALCWFFMDRYRVNTVVRLVFVAFAFFNPLIARVLSWVGLFDAWFDFRKLSTEGGGRRA